MAGGHHTASRVSLTCPNCGHALATDDSRPKHCPGCGQATTLHAPSFFEFVHEFVGHYVALEGSLWRTLGKLILRPGQLTAAYLQGQRTRYVLPLRLFLSASFLFFLLAKTVGPSSVVEVRIEGDLAAEMAKCRAPGTKCTPQEFDRLERLSVGDEAVRRDLVGRALGIMPYVVFVLVPIYAGIVQLAYRRRQRNFGEHFVFALHVHAFWFLAMLITIWLPNPLMIGAVVVVALHTLWALKVTYGGRWSWTILRAAIIAGHYLTVIIAGSIALGTWAFKA